ncbi:CobW family GTP-binding protein [Kitasatospora cathayae]|uniref:Class I SAM-dependent methyltransferase n=1 Tax=Kitasatospora cathayae TaxID=3004092 RepID=A0ABY7QC81_9ACTN|nr:class I SAM-dependent methyltransferase [Kitasatospora sp. HUAS 3-15]WBP90360.1 class I SAM-dependent methyltransferase [Kitasatospora sp. HUAS 3-15]
MPDDTRLPVVVVAGLHEAERRQAVLELLSGGGNAVVLHHDLTDAALHGRVRRAILDAAGSRSESDVPLTHDCPCCALREDLLPELFDPLLLELGRVGRPDAARYAEVMIGEPGWTEKLALDGPVDAVVSTAALHYPRPDRLGEIYRDLADVLRPGGVLVNGDHLTLEDPVLARFSRTVGRCRAERRGRRGTGEDWAGWWAAAAQVPEFAELLAARQRQLPPADGDGNGPSAAGHERLLRQAGFRPAGPVCQYGDSCVLVAVR